MQILIPCSKCKKQLKINIALGDDVNIKKLVEGNNWQMRIGVDKVEYKCGECKWN